MSAKTAASLPKFDTSFGTRLGDMSFAVAAIKINGKAFQLASGRDSAALPWKDAHVEVNFSNAPEPSISSRVALIITTQT